MIRRFEDGLVPLSLLNNSNLIPPLNHLHRFGCPVYIFDDGLQQKQKIDTWQQRNPIGKDLGLSPHHANSLQLVMSLRAESVLPQFKSNSMIFFSSEKSKGYFRKSEWQVKARLERQPQRQTPDIYRQPRRVFLNRET